MGYNLSQHDLEEIGGFEVMRLMTQWACADIAVTQEKYDDYQATWDQVISEVVMLTQKRVWVLLAHEDQMTDTTAYFTIYCEDENDANVVVSFYPSASLRLRAPSVPSPPPEWLVKYSKEQH
jgi:hypothetical protein